MSRKKIIAGNWKMNMTPSAAIKLCEELKVPKEDILLAAKYKLLDDKLPVLTAITEDGVAVFDWDYNCEK